VAHLRHNAGWTIAILLIACVGMLSWIDRAGNVRGFFFGTHHPSEALPGNKQEAVRAALLKAVVRDDPGKALTALKESMRSDRDLARVCHGFVHAIGHEAYRKYRDLDRALLYRNTLCNSGYLHGVIEEYFMSSHDVGAAMKSVCRPYPVGSLMSWECYHGVGHGAMHVMQGDLPRSLRLCDSYEKGFARYVCSNGIFMAFFDIGHSTLSEQKDAKNDALFICARQEARHKRSCYVYAPTYFLGLHEDDYAGALRWCEQAESAYTLSCVRGVGSQAIKENVNDPKFVEQICMNGNASQISACIDGMIGLYIKHSGSLEPARVLCARLEQSNRLACEKSVASHTELFAG
jgi:hypothetical protein